MEKGIYNIYKPKGPTSYDIIRRIKGLTTELLGRNQKPQLRIGHGGTLDPLASGVLIVAIGREFTRELDKVVKVEKEYIATVKLGQTSTTQDEEGEKADFQIDKIPDIADIEKTLKKFIGEITQTPPIYSALKINGQPAYKLARAGKDVEIKSRTITIRDVELLEYKWPILKIRVTCSAGTYIRTLANDIGANLKTGGYLADLVRSRIADFKIEDSIHLEG
jgi:tRNA pseudouridine55 synthase